MLNALTPSMPPLPPISAPPPVDPGQVFPVPGRPLTLPEEELDGILQEALEEIEETPEPSTIPVPADPDAFPHIEELDPLPLIEVGVPYKAQIAQEQFRHSDLIAVDMTSLPPGFEFDKEDMSLHGVLKDIPGEIAFAHLFAIETGQENPLVTTSLLRLPIQGQQTPLTEVNLFMEQGREMCHFYFEPSDFGFAKIDALEFNSLDGYPFPDGWAASSGNKMTLFPPDMLTHDTIEYGFQVVAFNEGEASEPIPAFAHVFSKEAAEPYLFTSYKDRKPYRGDGFNFEYPHSDWITVPGREIVRVETRTTALEEGYDISWIEEKQCEKTWELSGKVPWNEAGKAVVQYVAVDKKGSRSSPTTFEIRPRRYRSEVSEAIMYSLLALLSFCGLAIVGLSTMVCFDVVREKCANCCPTTQKVQDLFQQCRMGWLRRTAKYRRVATGDPDDFLPPSGDSIN